MALTRRSIATLLDLVEIKLSCIEVVDREDHRELKTLRACRDECCNSSSVCPFAECGRHGLPAERKRRAA